MAAYKLPIITGTSLTIGDLLRWDGSNWVNYADSAFQAQGDVLDDLNILGVNAADSEFLVGTGAGVLAWESGATVRTSIGLGTGDEPQFATLGIGNPLIRGVLSVKGQDGDGYICEITNDAGASSLRLSTTAAVFNEDSEDIDFRAESDNLAYAFFIEGSTGNIGLGPAAPAYKLSIGSADNTDQIGIYHDNTDAYCKWTDGGLYFITDEGTNTGTSVGIKGKGTGYGNFYLYDQDDAEYLRIRCVSGIGYVDTDGTSPGSLYLQPYSGQGVACFAECAEGEIPAFSIAGWRTGDSKRWCHIQVGHSAPDSITFRNVSNYYFDGNVSPTGGINIAGYLPTPSSGKYLRLGYVSGAFAYIQGYDYDTPGTVNILMQGSGGNVGLGTADFGTNANMVFALANGTAPTTSPANSVQLYSADYAAGHACLNIRNEDGDIIKLEQQPYTAISDPPTQAEVVAMRTVLINTGLMAAS